MADAKNTNIYNTDVHGLIRRMDRFMVEIFKAASGNISHTSGADTTRAKSYIKAVRSYLDWMTSQPALDLPETAPRPIQIPPVPSIPLIENESLFDLATLFELAREELANSQSARQPTGISTHDEVRVKALLDKAEQFIDNYISVIDPLDLPETAPNAPMAPAGKMGT
jgi:hypothetical protein